MQGSHPFLEAESEATEEKRVLVERILASATFEKSPRLRDFLQYICERALSGHPQEVHEQFIGHVVFKRPLDYNSSDDNIVRVSARHLRAKLNEYFETEGRQEKWLLTIPKGTYLPVFCERSRQDSLVDKVSDDLQSRRARRFLTLPVIAIASLAVLWLFVTGLAWRGVTANGTQTRPTSPGNFVKDLLTDSPGAVHIIMGDSALGLMEKLAGRPFSLQRYADRSYRNLPKKLASQPGMQLFWKYLSTKHISNMDEQEAGIRLLNSISGFRHNVTIGNALDFRPHNFMDGNFVMLGGPRANPWTKLFSSNLNFRFVYVRPGQPGKIHNLNPLPGEQEVYAYPSGENHDGNHVSYARVALVPNLTDTGRVLLIAGINAEATEAAADFILNPSSTKELLSILKLESGVQIPNFELLLETSAFQGTPTSVRVIAHRIYPGSPRG